MIPAIIVDEDAVTVHWERGPAYTIHEDGTLEQTWRIPGDSGIELMDEEQAKDFVVQFLADYANLSKASWVKIAKAFEEDKWW